VPSANFTISDGEIIIKSVAGTIGNQLSIAGQADASSGSFGVFFQAVKDGPFVAILDNDDVPVSIDATKISSATPDGEGQVIQWNAYSYAVKVVADAVVGITSVTVTIAQTAP
jgi:hypothetical protein